MAAPYDLSAPRAAFSASAVTRVLRDLLAPRQSEAQKNWLRAVASVTTAQRPDLAEDLVDILGAEPFEEGHSPLAELTIGEVGVCYEALIALTDSTARKSSGQYFTPDDAAHFMAGQSTTFPDGVWMDPCCGVGNLAWHLASVQNDPAEFVKDRLILVDVDRTALLSAVALIGADFLTQGDREGLGALHTRAVQRDFLSPASLPRHDHVIVNPPYARAPMQPGLRTRATREFFAFFIERITTSARGFIAVTPASYLAAPKFQILRDVLDEANDGGRIFVFDNVPDTLFRGYKFGSTNTSNTNFVRAAITVCSPTDTDWEITPIIRWRSASRPHVFPLAARLLAPRQIGPTGEWVKLPAALGKVWERLAATPTVLSDLLVRHETPHSLTVGLTPRYYISAAYRNLERGSKAVLYFANDEDRDRAALVLNSSIPYIWWRALDGGVTLPKRVLFGTPIPEFEADDATLSTLARELQETEEASITTKLNAGLVNENVKRPPELVDRLNRAILGESPDLRILYTEDMAAPR